MTNHKITPEIIQAAQALFSSNLGDIKQVHEIHLRDVDQNADPENFRTVVLIPIGSILGIAITKNHAAVEDRDIVFVSMDALGNALPALGFTVAFAARPTSYIVHPRGAKENQTT